MRAQIIAIDAGRGRVAVFCDDGTHAGFELPSGPSDLAVGDAVQGELGTEGEHTVVNVRTHAALEIRVRLAGCSLPRALAWTSAR